MEMTWATAEDFVSRLMPYLARLNTGQPVTEELRDRVEKPFVVKRAKTP